MFTYLTWKDDQLGTTRRNFAHWSVIGHGCLHETAGLSFDTLSVRDGGLGLKQSPTAPCILATLSTTISHRRDGHLAEIMGRGIEVGPERSPVARGAPFAWNGEASQEHQWLEDNHAGIWGRIETKKEAIGIFIGLQLYM